MNSATTNPADETLRQINAIDFWARARWGVTRLFNTDAGYTLEMHAARGLRIAVTLETTDVYTVNVTRVTMPKFNRRTGQMSDHKVVCIGEQSDCYVTDLVRVIDRLLSK
jgi:hypothetical protein